MVRQLIHKCSMLAASHLYSMQMSILSGELSEWNVNNTKLSFNYLVLVLLNLCSPGDRLCLICYHLPIFVDCMCCTLFTHFLLRISSLFQDLRLCQTSALFLQDLWPLKFLAQGLDTFLIEGEGYFNSHCKILEFALWFALSIHFACIDSCSLNGVPKNHFIVFPFHVVVEL
jgi:hypothetical protein